MNWVNRYPFWAESWCQENSEARSHCRWHFMGDVPILGSLSCVHSVMDIVIDSLWKDWACQVLSVQVPLGTALPPLAYCWGQTVHKEHLIVIAITQAMPMVLAVATHCPALRVFLGILWSTVLELAYFIDQLFKKTPIISQTHPFEAGESALREVNWLSQAHTRIRE